MVDSWEIITAVQLANNFVREAEGCRWELKARNSAVQLCAKIDRQKIVTQKFFAQKFLTQKLLLQKEIHKKCCGFIFTTLIFALKFFALPLFVSQIFVHLFLIAKKQHTPK